MHGTAAAVPATQVDRDNPWPGLESFEEDAKDYFHGREAEADELLRRVADAPLTVLFGKSGLGKTSLLKAGLFPRLREKRFLPVHVRLDIRPEAPGLIDQLRDGLRAAIARERIDAPPFAPGETLWKYLHRADLELWSEQNHLLTPVLVLDQFEEVFTLGDRLPETVERFKIDLGDLAENRIPAALAGRLAEDASTAQRLDLRRMAYKLVVTLREDFLPHLEGWRAAVPSLGRVRLRLLPMRPEQALSAVYDTAPHLMDPPLARRIVEFVAAAQTAASDAQGDGSAQESSAGGEIEPALLSLFCRGLNEQRKRQGKSRFDEQLLEGAQQSIIADYYSSCVEGLPDSASRFIETDLITEKGFRNSYAKDDAVPILLTQEQLDRLINRRLLRLEERYGTARIELTHDLLTRAVMAHRDRRRAEEEKAALARRAEEERQALAAQARTQRRRVLVLALIALICLAFAGIAAWQWREAVAAQAAAEKAKDDAENAKNEANQERSAAEREKTAAERERDRAQTAEDKARAAESEALRQAQLAEESAAGELVARNSSEARRTEAEARLVFGDSGNALARATLLSAASVRFARTVDGQISLTRYLGLLPRPPLWRESVGPTGIVANGKRQRALAVSPDGARIAVVGPVGPLQILDARTGKTLHSFEVPERLTDRTTLAFSPDGAFLVLGCAHQACVLDAASGELLARLPRDKTNHGTMVWSASFSSDGKHLAMASYASGEVLVYDVPTWRTTATLDSGSDSVFSVAFSPKGEWLVVGGGFGLQLWRAGGEYEVPAVRASTDLAWSIAFHPGDYRFIAGSRNLRVWDIAPDGEVAVQLHSPVSRPIEAHTVLPVSWRGRPCFAAATPDAIHLLCGPSLEEEVLRVPVPSAAAAISSDARWLFNQQDDGTLAAIPLDTGLDAHRIRLGAPVRSMDGAGQRGWLAAGMDNGEIAVVDLDTWKERRRLRLPASAAPVGKVTASPDGRWLGVTRGKSLHVFDAGNWREIASRAYGQDVNGAAFDATGRWLAVVSDTTVAVWQRGDWRERRFEHGGEVEAVSVSPDGRRLATFTRWAVGRDSGVLLTRVFDLASGNEVGWEYTSGGSYASKEFMREEAARRQRPLAGGDTASVREAESSWPALELDEPDERVSADGAWKGGFSGSVATLSDVAAGREIGRFDQGGEITSVRFVPTRAPRWLVSAGTDGTLAVWPIRTDDLADEACARLKAIFGTQALGKLIADAHAERGCEAD